MIFFLAVALIVVALTPLALPLLGLATAAVRLRFVGTAGVVPGESSQLEVELSVRRRLYGDRRDLATTPIPRSAGTSQRRTSWRP